MGAVVSLSCGANGLGLNLWIGSMRIVSEEGVIGGSGLSSSLP